MPATFQGRSILITGGAGMLGSTLASRLVGLGARVRILDAMAPEYGGNTFNLAEIRDRIQFIQGDIRNAETLLQAAEGVDYVFNLAAQVSYTDSNLDMFRDLDINCRGQINLLEACRQAGNRPKILFASSRFVYGRIEVNPVDEKHPLNCLSIYGIHKLTGEKYHRFYFERYGIPTVSLRISNPYGPRQQMKHGKYGIVNWFIRQALEGKPLTIYGQGMQKRDYIYAEDIAEAFLQAAISPATDGQVYNVGSGRGIPFRDMAGVISEIVPGTTVVETEWNPGSYFVETGDYVSDISKLQRDTGWAPKTSLRQGIEQTVAYYRLHRNRYWTSEQSLVSP